MSEAISWTGGGRVFRIQCTAMPQLELYDTIRFTDATRNIDSLCNINSINWVYEKGRFTMTLTAVEL